VLRLQKGVKGGAFIQEGDTSRMNVVMQDMLSLGTISSGNCRRRVSKSSMSSCGWLARMRDRPISMRSRRISNGPSLRPKRVGCSIGSNAPGSFYKLLAASSGNKVIAMIMDSVTEIHMRFVYAKVASSGVAMARLAEKRRKFLSALSGRNVSLASRLMRAHLESVQRMLEQDPGAMSLQVALAEVQPGMRR